MGNHCVKDAAKKQRERHETFLGSVEILKTLSADERAKVAEALKGLTFSDGEKIICEGDAANELFIVEEGTAEARKGGKMLMAYKRGEYFGELGLLKNAPRAADVVATATPTKVLTIDRVTFDSLLGPLATLMEERTKNF